MNTFTAKDANGVVYTIVIHPLPGKRGAAFGRGVFTLPSELVAFKTSDGWDVNRLDTGKYQITLPGVLLTSDDPNAP